jgi:DnaK suppressor protein
MPKASGSRWATDRVEEFRGALERKAAELRERLSAERAAEVVQRPEEPLDFGDWCQKSHDEWLFLNQNRLEMALLRDIEAALRRIEEGGYGRCQECAEPISIRRLSVLPWARFCASCQERFSDSPGRK